MDDKPKLRPVEVFPLEGREGQVCVRDATGVTEHVVTGATGILRLLRLLDGEHNLLDIQAQLTRETGELVMSDDVKRMLDVLDDALLLDNEHFASYRRERVDAFTKSPVRKASSAGGSYPDDPDELRAFLDDILAAADPTTEATPRGLIAPHIDHHRGRRSYADAYATLAKGDLADLVIILGTAHTETVERFALTRKDFETPLGVARTDTDVVDMLLERSGRDLLVDEFVHAGEHSVELELVFIQHLAQKARRDFRIVPILCGSFQEAMVEDTPPASLGGVSEMIAGLREIVADGTRRVMIVAGADLAHVGPRFGGDRRVTKRTLAEVERADRETLAFVVNGDADGFYECTARDENARNICSIASIYLTLKTLEPCAATLLDYDQWCADDGSSCVTFAACAVS